MTSTLKVAILALENARAFDLAVPYEVLDAVRLPDGRRPYELLLCALEPAVPGQRLTARGWEERGVLRDSHTVIVPGRPVDGEPVSPDVVLALQRAVHTGKRIAALSTGTFVLAEAGLLDGVPVAAHWSLAKELVRRHPSVQVRPDALFVDSGSIVTSAGASAGLDLCLHLVQRDFGAEVATRAARQLLLPLQRPGGQAPFAVPDHPMLPGTSRFADLLTWIDDNLSADLSLYAMAERCGLNVRTLSRQFPRDIGVTPQEWVTQARIGRARELLASTDLPVEGVAKAAGFSSLSNFRARFRQVVGLTPKAYRASFHDR
ncbi:GlxA family transcriptional regulator [Streptomyces mirabilis]|uniref:Helix-turn-helix domain-containing protein n=1 Tax=Streptomyces mirabilis TaxID=68239 RepID=A0ABU3V5A4_9ACTN|nr:helix-turn-helix domain-containing protein [Streptomyces mirabilis]MCX5355711.1 helix-turn-helix domain-containing protein [Streptomyces mirabilis]MDU9001354.1 helix-turn-helix domain-containing protein [Streptomyces mirabilis]